MAAGNTLSYCYSQIESARERSISGKYFVQQPRIRQIFTQEVINSAVAEITCDDHDRIGLAKTVHQDGIITFAILIWRRRADFIVHFRNHESLDSKLPIHEARAKEIAPEFGASFAREYQWEFLPYFFKHDMSQHHRHINDIGMIFPFVGEEEHVAEGGFGEVSRLNIPVNMQQLSLSVDYGFVKVIRKRIKPRCNQSTANYNKTFTQEMACLRLLSSLHHPNIVPLLGSYTVDGVHNLLFPSFDMDLDHFFSTESRFGEFHWNFNFHRALSGIASALEHTHNLRLNQSENGLDVDAIGYHYDLRPANILISKTLDTFILADFGLGRLKPAQADSATPWKRGAGDYIAPECMSLELVHQQVGRAVDVWAFGCLITEVVIYMERGLEGLNLFRKSRWAELVPGVQTTYFYGAYGELKPSVRRWLENISHLSSSTKETIMLALEILRPDPQSRPRMSNIRRQLSSHSLVLLFQELLNVFGDYIERTGANREQSPASMQLWFERERLLAFGYALRRSSDQSANVFQGFQEYDACWDTLRKLLRMLASELDKVAIQVETTVDLAGSLEGEIKLLIQVLWNLLPQSHSRSAQATWLQSIQNDEITRLNGIDFYCRGHRQSPLNDVGALARMRAIRIHMLNDPTSGAKEFLCPREDLDHIELVGSHTYSTFRKNVRVLVEWMYYRSEKTDISEHQKLLIMELRAKEFNIDPKPQGLRILKCLGFVEQPSEEGQQPGYGFLYELPAELSQDEYPITLQDLLIQGTERSTGIYRQAPLLGRLRLAYALAVFFQGLFTVGFLHESFSSTNVIFGHPSEAMFTSTQTWSEPYIIGYQKSRPDGPAWCTEGPSEDTSMCDYEHPDYRRTERFVLEYDHYSLGLVLLEIGLWCPLQAWSRKHKALAPQDFRTLLIEKYVPRLTATVGEVYRDVVLVCLNGSMERDRLAAKESVDSEVFGDFIERIVNPLEELSNLQI